MGQIDFSEMAFLNDILDYMASFYLITSYGLGFYLASLLCTLHLSSGMLHFSVLENCKFTVLATG